MEVSAYIRWLSRQRGSETVTIAYAARPCAQVEQSTWKAESCWKFSMNATQRRQRGFEALQESVARIGQRKVCREIHLITLLDMISFVTK
jgi:hypothetical protein